MDMIRTLHHYIMFLGVLYMLFAVIRALMGWLGKRPFSAMDAKMGKIAMIVINIQALLGIVLLAHWVSLAMAFSMGEVMKHAETRNIVIEHPSMMLIAVALISLGYSRARKQTDSARKHRTSAIFFGVGLVVILAAIPWWKVF